MAQDYKLKFKIDADASKAKSELNSLQGRLNNLSGRFTATFGGAVPMANAAALAIAGAGLAVFNLTARVAEYGSEIFDAEQKTGLTAETLSALKYAADTSGSSLENITGSVAKFNVLLGDAKNGNEKAIKTLEQYGITAKDNDQALAQAIKTIASETDATKQASAAKALFKDRTGEVLPVIKSFSGDLPGLIAKLRDLGLIMSGADTRAADEFGDTLDTLKMQAGAVGRQFALGLMPSVTHAMQTISTSMKGNKSAAIEWGESVGRVVRGTEIYFTGLGKSIDSVFAGMNRAFGSNIKNTYSWSDALLSLNPILAGTIALARKMPGFGETGSVGGKQYEWDPATNTVRQVQAGAPGGVVDAAPDASGTKAKGPNIIKVPGANLTEELKRGALDAERRRVQAARQLFVDETEFFETEAEKRYAIAVQYAEKEGKTEYDLAAFKDFLTAQVLENRKSKLQQYLDALIKGTEEYERAQQEMRILDQEIETTQANNAKNAADRTKDKSEKEKKLHDERKKRWGEHLKYLHDLDEREEAELQRRTREFRLEQEAKMVTAPGTVTGGIAGALGVDLTGIFRDNDEMKTEAEFMKDIMADLDQFVGESIGNLIGNLAQLAAQWLITGDVSAKAALQMVAGIALGIAIEAGLKALFNYAEGLAALANPFTAHLAPGYFAAAKSYATVAAVAGAIGVGTAILGRAVGGGQGGSAATAAGGGGGSGAAASNDPYSRSSTTAFSSGSDPRAVARAIERLADRIDGVSPGNILVAGSREKRGFIGRQVVSEIGSDASIGRKLLSRSGLK